MSAIINLVCLSFLASLPSAFAGPPSDLPFEQLVGNSDLIVIGRVATKDGPKTCHLRLPHTKDQVTFRCSNYLVTIEKILLDKSGTVRETAVMVVARDLPPAPDLQTPRLDGNVSYLFILQRMPGAQSEHYLPDYYKHYLPASPDHIESLTKALSAP
jgi:hypothetical protein